jgi:hypothetical protein
MLCQSCGSPITTGSLLCDSCGRKVEKEEAVRETSNETFSPLNENSNDHGFEEVHESSGARYNSGISIDQNGIHRWAYEMNMWKNPALIITTWKVLLLAALVPSLLVFFLDLGSGAGPALINFLGTYGLVAGIVTALILLAYPLVAIINGGKYCVVFEMDSESVKHMQMQKQFKRNQVLSMLTVLAGAAAGSPQTAGAGLLAGTKRSLLSTFSKVKSVVVNEKRNIIYVNENFTRNQVYADSDNFAFVQDYIISRCSKAKVKYK